MHIGRKEQIGIGKESTKGTPVAASKWLPVTSGALQPGNSKAKDLGRYGSIASTADSYVSKQRSDIEISGVARDQSMGMLLMSAFGTVNKTGSDPYTHTFTLLNNNNHPAYTIWSMNDVSTEKASYCMLSELELSVDADGYVMYKAKFLGKARVSDSDPTPSYDEENEFRGRDIKIYFASSEAGLSGATAINAKSVRLTINKNLKEYQAIGSVDLNSIYNQNITVMGDFELLYSANTHIDVLEANTKQYMKIEVINTDVDLGGGVNPKMSFVLNKCAYETRSKTDGADDIVMESIGFEAEYNNTDGEIINCVLINGDDTSY